MIAKDFADHYNKYLEHLEAHLNANINKCPPDLATRLKERISDFKTFVAVLEKIEAYCEERGYA